MLDNYRQHLTDRQKEILKLACFSNSEIGNRLFIAETTVATHLNAIRTIIPTTTKAALLIEAIRRGEINIDEVETP